MTNLYTELPLEPIAGSYPTVATYADLPDPNSVQGTIYVVTTTTGMWPMQNLSGFYLAAPAGWAYLGKVTPGYIKSLYESNANTNAFTDYYKSKLDGIVAGAITANAVIVQFDSDASTVPGNIVISSGSNAVTALNGNVYSGLAFGICYAKPTATTAQVQVAGVYQGFTGLVIGGPAFVGTDGAVTTTPPATGNIQVIGIAVQTTAISVNFAPSKVTRP